MKKRARPGAGPARLHWLQFFPSDWIRDTRDLTVAAKGLWIELLCGCFLNRLARGTFRTTVRKLARRVGGTPMEVRTRLLELGAEGVAVVSWRGSRVTVTCRRMVREEKERALAKRRMKTMRRRRSPPKRVVTPLLRTGDQETRRPGGQEPRKPECTTGALAGAPGAAVPQKPPADAPLRSAAPPAAGVPGADVGSCSPNLSGAPTTALRDVDYAGGPGGAVVREGTGLRPPGVPPHQPRERETDLPPDVQALATKLRIHPAVIAAEIGVGAGPVFTVAWLLVTAKRRPHDEKRGGATAYFRGLCKKGAEPPDWAMAGAKLLFYGKTLTELHRKELAAVLLKGFRHAEIT